ncbi:MAG: hypothetical protein RL033_3836 [Pseudomonadota bacterium]
MASNELFGRILSDRTRLTAVALALLGVWACLNPETDDFPTANGSGGSGEPTGVAPDNSSGGSGGSSSGAFGGGAGSGAAGSAASNAGSGAAGAAGAAGAPSEAPVDGGVPDAGVVDAGGSVSDGG